MRVKQTISRLIESELKRGRIYFLEDFKSLGNYNAVKTEFSRLAKGGTVIRLGNGIYLYPKVDPQLGPLLPSLEEVAHAIAANDKINIKPSAEYAMQQIGLSTQVPMNLVYLTDGRSKKIKILNHTITFKGVSPKKLASKGKISSPVIQALEAKGREKLTNEDLKIIRSLLVHENPLTLKEDIKTAPSWISDLLISILNESKNTISTK